MVAPVVKNGLIRGGWAPALLLIVGIYAVTAFLSHRGLSVEAMGQFRADWGTYPVGHYPLGWWADPAWIPVPGPSSLRYLKPAVIVPDAEGRLRAIVVVLTVVYLGAATAVGSFVVDGLRGEDRWPGAVSALAGFLPGYLMVLVPLQVLFAVAPLRFAAWLAVIGLPVVAVVLHRHGLAAAARSLRRDPASRRRATVLTVAAATVVAVASLHRLQAGNFFLFPDSPLWWIVGGGDQMHGAFGSHLAQFNQQSDEWVFGAPLMFSSHSTRDAFFPLYAGQSLGLASFVCLMFGLVHRLALRRKNLAACMASAVVLAATPLIYPWRYVTIIGGDNPMLWTGQPGRQIGIVAPLAAVLLLGCRQRPATMIAAAFAMAGLAFTSAQNAVYVLGAVGVVVVWQMRGGWTQGPGLRAMAHVFPLGAVGMLVSAFYLLHETQEPTRIVWLLVAGIAIATIGAVAIGLGTGRTVARSLTGGLSVIVAAVVVMAVGFVLSNNQVQPLLGGRVRDVLSAVLPGYNGPLLARPDLNQDLLAGLHFPEFSATACGIYHYCMTFEYFLASFAFLLLIALATWFAFGRVTSQEAVNAHRVAWLLLMATLAGALIAMFFTGAPIVDQPAVFSRLLDVPYYWLLALAAMTFAGSSNRLTAIVGTGVLAVWTITPLVASRWPEQMIDNGRWLLAHAGLS